jgi:hypothetical protein
VIHVNMQVRMWEMKPAREKRRGTERKAGNETN